MHAITELPLHTMLGTLLWLLSAGALWQGLRQLATGLREIDHPASPASSRAWPQGCDCRRESTGLVRRDAVHEHMALRVWPDLPGRRTL